MNAPPCPEALRLQALRDYAADPAPDPQLDELVALAARLCQTPSAALSLVGADRQWFKARHGLPPAELPRDVSLCAHAIAQPEEVFVVRDARADPRFAAHPLVADPPGIRFYAGAPLRTAAGHALGTVCVIDRQPRDFSDEQRHALTVLARHALTRLELQRSRHLAAELEQRYRILLNHNPLPLFVFDRTTFIYLTVNAAALAHYGYTQEEFLRMTVFDLRPAEDRARLRCQIEHGASGLSRLGRWRHRKKSGEIVDVDVFGHDLDFDNRPARLVLAVDVSEQVRAHASLAASEARFRALSDFAPVGIFESDTEGRCTYINPTLAEIVGRPPASALRFAWAKILHPHDRARVRAGWTRAALTGHRWRGEIRLVQPGGAIRWVNAMAAPNKDAHGRVIGFVGTIDDITEKRSAELALRESEERFKVVARAVSDVVWDWNLTEQNIWWSDGLPALFGHTAAEIPDAAAWLRCIHPDDRDRVQQSIREKMAGSTEWEAEYRFRRKEGTYAHVVARAQIMRDDRGEPVRMIGGMSDHTERKTLEAQFLRAQRMESIGTLAGGIAHDLNNVLTPIVLSLDLLKEDLDQNPHHLALLKTLQSSARRGADLVRQVLTFARGVEGQRVSVNVRSLLEELERIVRETFPRNLELTFSAPPDLWPIIGDATHIHQVLLNLAVNARDAMPAGGPLSVLADNVVLDRVRAGTALAAQPGSYVRVQIVDTGIGITRETRERIFEPFFTTKPPGKGTGLGLATVHAVVKSHRGFVEVESEPGRGTTFSVYLPANPISAAGTRPPFAKSLPRGRGELILVVDDEEAIRLVADRILRDHNYRVLMASNGLEGRTLFEAHERELALVITDMMMPVMDGAALIQSIRARNLDLKIIAASGLHVREDVARAASVGGAHFLSKPFTADTLLQLVRDVLDGRTPAPS